jgi:hypothetical protein
MKHGIVLFIVTMSFGAFLIAASEQIQSSTEPVNPCAGRGRHTIHHAPSKGCVTPEFFDNIFRLDFEANLEKETEL